VEGFTGCSGGIYLVRPWSARAQGAARGWLSFHDQKGALALSDSLLAFGLFLDHLGSLLKRRSDKI
jgi:hypothetical protein